MNNIAVHADSFWARSCFYLKFKCAFRCSDGVDLTRIMATVAIRFFSHKCEKNNWEYNYHHTLLTPTAIEFPFAPAPVNSD